MLCCGTMEQVSATEVAFNTLNFNDQKAHNFVLHGGIDVVGLQNQMALIIMTRWCVMCNSHATSLKVKVTLHA